MVKVSLAISGFNEITFEGLFTPIVKMSAAASPMILPAVRIKPVIRPGKADGMTIVRIVRHLVEPSASPPSRRSRDTDDRAFSKRRNANGKLRQTSVNA